MEEWRTEPLPYLEAYPQLRLAELGWKGNWEVEWKNEHHDPVGSAVAAWTREMQVVLSYEFYGTPEVRRQSGTIEIDIGPRMHGVRRWRQYAPCRACGSFVQRLVFKEGAWLCSTCQGLRNRSTYLTSEQRRHEEYQQLRYELSEGRPPGMREAQYRKALERLNDLKPYAKAPFRARPPEYIGIVYASYAQLP